jgi:20S proteasome subunit alpha 6
MRQQAMGSKMLYGRPIPVARIVQGISDRESAVVGSRQS